MIDDRGRRLRSHRLERRRTLDSNDVRTTRVDGSEIEHVRAAIAAAPMHDDPSPYTYVENLFSSAVYAAILQHFPADTSAFRRFANPRDGMPRFAEYDKRHEIDLSTDLHRLAPAQATFWGSLAALLCGPAFARVLIDRFRPAIAERFGALADSPTFAEDVLRGTMILNAHDPGYYLGPHTDRNEKVFTVLLYFPESDGLEHLGTSRYRPLETGRRCGGHAHYDPREFELIDTAPYKPNSAFIFVRTDVLFHGVHLLSEAELRGSRRRGVQMQFFVRNERPREDCAVTIDGTLPSELGPGETAVFRYRLVNRAARELFSSFPYTTQIGYRWFADGALVKSAAVGLTGTIAAGAARDGALTISAPDAPGRYRLAVSVVQDRVAWFDDLDPQNGVACNVRVGEGSSASPGSDPAALPEWATIVSGAYEAERFGGESFYWIHDVAVIAVEGGEHRVLRFVVEKGPGLGDAPLLLHAIADDGTVLADMTTSGRAEFAIPLSGVALPASIRLVAAGGGARTAGDPRILNYRILPASQAENSAPIADAREASVASVSR